jgi:hypothetical protein
MIKGRPLPFWTLLLFVACLISCGAGNNRKLQSISIAGIANNGQISFIATGTFNSAPISVTPLPVSWLVEDPTTDYSLTTQPLVVPCVGLVVSSVGAMAPIDPHAPSIGLISSTKMVSATAPILCP